METQKKFSLLLVLLLFFAVNLNGQNIADATVKITPIQNSDSTVLATFNISVTDTTDISQIEVQLGMTSGSYDLSNVVFDFDSTPLSPYGYDRIDSIIMLSLGSIRASEFYFARARTKNLSGTWSSYYEFVFN